ncbi:sigma-70 family RNA polymerase sigma factor [uncultured Clostridium sp.]|uniref:sigma-70 family RNA polymerase sigma factor n=1 Tax=uncultured Clostridium sp. TaxID=59620 RepID=UPI0025F9BCDA|nr:sigma-70 family RNA polymerase sigma factor [uncultured Clostridium sp.]
MNYKYIEKLVKESKTGNESSKEKLAEEFRPFIINISRRTFIHGYDFEDIMNECYRILFKCISLYNIETHRFVAYATNGIKNSINDLIKKQLKNNKIQGSSVNSIDKYIEESYKADIPEMSDILFSEHDKNSLKYAINQLSPKESDFINHIFFQNKTLKSYAEHNNISYSYAFKKKKYILDKLFMYINIYNN